MRWNLDKKWLPDLLAVVGLGTAVPLVSLIAVTLYAVNLARYRRSINLGELKRLALAVAFGGPVGLWLVGGVTETAREIPLRFLHLHYDPYALFHTPPALSPPPRCPSRDL